MTDMTFGYDARGDYALFIDKKRMKDSDSFNEETTEYLKNEWINASTFFRLIDGGQQLRSHGWIENGKIVQWG
jgi:hypothetical protein